MSGAWGNPADIVGCPETNRETWISKYRYHSIYESKSFHENSVR
jgi:hypothetical protein